MNTGRKFWTIEEISYLFAKQKASVNVTSNHEGNHTSAIEFMRAMNSSGLASAMIMNTGRRLISNEGIALLSEMQKASVFVTSRMKPMLMSVREHMRATS